MAIFYVFKLISIVCFVNALSGCRANIMHIEMTKNDIARVKNLRIESFEDVVLIKVDVKIPVHSHDSVTINEITCWDTKWYIVINNDNFFNNIIVPTADTSVYRFISTQKLMTLSVTDRSWKWECALFTHWQGCKCNVAHNFSVVIETYKTDVSTPEKISLYGYQGPVDPKLFTCTPYCFEHVDNSSSQQRPLAKNNLKPTEKSFTNAKYPDTKSQNGENQIYDETDGIQIGEEHTNNFEDEENNLSQCYGEAATSTAWVICSAASVVMFLVGLVIGVVCRRPQARGTELNRADDQNDEHSYDEVDAKGINNRPPLPVPDQAMHEYVYNTPYDHTLRFQNQIKLV